MKKWHWIVLALFSYIGFLIAYLPATLVTQQIETNTNQQVRFNGVSGTLFEGSAQALTYKGLRINNLDWSLSPLHLLLLKANLHIDGGNMRSADSISIKGNVSTSLLNTKKIAIDSTQLFVPAKTAMSQVQLPVPVVTSGRIRLDITSFEFDQTCQQLEGKGAWLNAGIDFQQRQTNLGVFEANLSCQAPDIIVQILPDNALTLDAKIRLQADGKFFPEGTYAIPSDFPPALKQGAAFFGQETRPGQYQIIF